MGAQGLRCLEKENSEIGFVVKILCKNSGTRRPRQLYNR